MYRTYYIAIVGDLWKGQYFPNGTGMHPVDPATISFLIELHNSLMLPINSTQSRFCISLSSICHCSVFSLKSFSHLSHAFSLFDQLVIEAFVTFASTIYNRILTPRSTSQTPFIMDSRLLLLLGISFLASTTIYLLSSKPKRNLILERLHLRRRRTSGASTPPRSLSPEKDSSTTAGAEYREVFPPSRRFTLETVAPELFKKNPKPSTLDAASEEKGRESVPIDVAFEHADPNAYTPCEFSAEEIKALGDFPDYAALSGVPLPKAYPEFDIKKALPRPYRPFRWAYHQTMCKYNISALAITL